LVHLLNFHSLFNPLQLEVNPEKEDIDSRNRELKSRRGKVIPNLMAKGSLCSGAMQKPREHPVHIGAEMQCSLKDISKEKGKISYHIFCLNFRENIKLYSNEN
jgi:hypothetical protein